MNFLTNILLFFLSSWKLLIIGIIFIIIGTNFNFKILETIGYIFFILGIVFFGGKLGTKDKRFKTGFRPHDWNK
jgi:hypothetical protein